MTMTNESIRVLACATPKSDKPAPKGKPEMKITKKLPVPPPKPAQVAASAADDPFHIPDELLAKNRKPLTPEQQAKADAVMAKVYTPAKAQTDLRAKQAEAKKDAAKAKRSAKTAKSAAPTTAMPLSGKAALRAIADKAVKENGVTKVPAGVRSLATVPTPRDAKGKIMSKKTAKAAKPAKTKAGKDRSKLDMIAAMLTRKSGCTSAEVLAATGWPSVSMPQQAKAAGLKLIKDKQPGEVTRYRAKA